MSSWQGVVTGLETLTGSSAQGSLMNQAATLLEEFTGTTSFGSLSTRIANAAAVLDVVRSGTALNRAAANLESASGLTSVASAVERMRLAIEEGIEALWTFADATTLAWYDAADLATITEVAGAISAWADKGSVGTYHAVQAGAGKPTIGASPLGGLNVIDFAAASSQFFNIAVPLSSGAFSVFMVFKPSGVAGSYVLAGSSSRPAILSQFGAVPIEYYGNIPRFAIKASGAEWSNIAATTVSGGTAIGYLDGTQTGTGGSQTAFGGAETFSAIGANQTGGASYYDGSIAEIAILAGVATTDEFDRGVASLAWKWDGGVAGPLVTALDASNPYKSAPPTV